MSVNWVSKTELLNKCSTILFISFDCPSSPCRPTCPTILILSHSYNFPHFLTCYGRSKILHCCQWCQHLYSLWNRTSQDTHLWTALVTRRCMWHMWYEFDTSLMSGMNYGWSSLKKKTLQPSNILFASRKFWCPVENMLGSWFKPLERNAAISHMIPTNTIKYLLAIVQVHCHHIFKMRHIQW